MIRKLCGQYLYLFPILFMSVFCYSLITESTFLGAEDDAFFYFRIADNLVQEGSVSFDGITTTNGFHPLWLGLLTVLRYLITAPVCYLSVVAVVSVALMTMCGILFAGFSKGRYSSPVVLVVLLLLLRYIRDFSMMCMETSVFLPVSFALLMLLDRVSIRSSTKILWLTGVLMALMGASRLDSAVLGILLAIFFFKNCGRKVLIPILLPGALLVLVYLSVNYITTGAFTSVSSMMKASGFGFNQLFARQLFFLNDPLGLRSPWGLYLLLLLAAFPVSFLKKMPQTAKASSLFLIIFTAFQLFLSQWRLWYWYAYPAVIFLAFGIPPLLQLFYNRLRLPGKLTKIVTIALCFSAFALSIYWGLSYGDVKGSDFRYRNMLIAQELNTILSDNSVVAMGDRAGSFAYFFNGHVIQAEGLSGDIPLVNAIQEGKLAEHLRAMGAEYILSWTGPHGVDAYEYWELIIPDEAQSGVFNNSITVYREDEIMRWAGENESVFLWRFNDR
jgi:hypothetical protein